MITRDWIRDDILIYTEKVTGGLRVYGKKDICEFINYWKLKLLSHNAKPGDKLGFTFENTEIHSYALMFAAFELGLRVVVLHRPSTEKECLSPKSNAHLPLDFYVYLTSYLRNSTTVTGVNHYRKHSKVCIGYGPMQWSEFSDDFRSNEETPILAEPNTIAFCCNSSGTTGDPKLISYTHQFLYDLCTNNWNDLGYKDDDTIVHLSSLNHGGVITLLLPALRTCKTHFFYNYIFVSTHERLLTFMDVCIEYNVTKIFFANGGELNTLIDHLVDTDKKLPLARAYILSFISPNWINAIRDQRLKEIVSVFGCSEICGPVFMPRLDNSNVDDFDPKLLGKPMTGFYETKIIDNRIHTKLKDGREFVFDDVVEDRAEGAYFISKNRLQKINDVDINPLDIIEIVERYVSRYEFELYVDEIYNEIYIITSNANLDRDKIRQDISAFYLDKITLTDIIYEKELYDTRITHKAERDKLSHIVERFRLTIQNNSV